MKVNIIIIIIISFFIASISSAGESYRKRQSLAEDRYTQSDVEEEIRFGREISARILGRIPLYNNKELTSYINLLGKALAENCSRSDLEFYFGILDTEEVNAYSAPGGYVFVTKGALKYVNDESELAGILAHEIAHITERHIVKELNIKGIEDDPVSGFARFIGGGTDVAKVAFAQAVDKALDILFKNGYRRENEIESDKIAVFITAGTNYDPKGLLRYLDRISALEEKRINVGKTHPLYEKRLSDLENFIKDEVGAGSFYKNRSRYESIIKRAKIK
ncbi:MAG: M48 family metalloprotease [Proteobacteria bacterium]|nr:M48 family metalloprotease [Pseudomonadota bacterium]